MASDCGNDVGVGAAIALSTGSLHCWALDRVFGMAAATGYDGVELLVDARMDSYDVPYLRRLSERWGIAVLSVHTPFARHVEGWPECAEGRVERAVHLAEELGARTVVAHAPLRWQTGHFRLAIGGWQFERLLVLPWESRVGARYTRWLLEELPALQAQTGVRVAVENMPAHRVWGRPLRLHRFTCVEELRQFPHLVLDTTHWGTCGVDPLGVYRALEDRVIHVHLSDYDGREHRMPFKGELALERLLQAMREAHFGGVLVVEVEPGAVAEGDWGAEHLMRSLEAAATQCRALLAARPSHSHDGQANPSLPNRPGRTC